MHCIKCGSKVFGKYCCHCGKKAESPLGLYRNEERKLRREFEWWAKEVNRGDWVCCYSFLAQDAWRLATRDITNGVDIYTPCYMVAPLYDKLHKSVDVAKELYLRLTQAAQDCGIH